MIVELSMAGISGGINAVLSDALLADRLSRSARAYAEEHLSWPGFVKLVDDLGQAAIKNDRYRRRS
jgi:hypothetical protein